jgi:hypothetical protein
MFDYWRAAAHGLITVLRDAFAYAHANGARRLAWSPFAAFSQPPIEALSYVSRAGRGDAAIATAPGLKVLAQRKRPRGDTIGLSRVAPIAGGDSDIPLAALERRVIEGLSTQSPSEPGAQTALHVATHSEWDGQEVKILIAPSELIAVADLARTRFWAPRPRLVILASCESNFDLMSTVNTQRIASPAQELIDLGVGGVIATLWPVSDAAAFLFSTSLHRRMVMEGQSPLDAFGATKAGLRNSNRTEFERFAYILNANGLIEERDVDLVMASIDSVGGGDKPFSHPHSWSNFVYWGV